MIDERLIGKELAGNGRGLFEVLSLKFYGANSQSRQKICKLLLGVNVRAVSKDTQRFCPKSPSNNIKYKSTESPFFRLNIGASNLIPSIESNVVLTG
jgi:hypothetical protein